MLESPAPDEFSDVYYTLATSKLSRSPDEYDLVTLSALLNEQKIGVKHLERLSAQRQATHHWSEEELNVFSETGDPLFDKWEREIAEGLDPDLDEEG